MIHLNPVRNMITVQPTVVACPVCGKQYRNKFGKFIKCREGKLWSDGYRANNPVHVAPLFSRCRECYAYFRIADSSAAVDPDILADDGIPVVRILKPGELAETLALKSYRDPEEEKYLRTQLWWALNGPVRSGQAGIDPEFVVLFEENLETLIYKTISNGPESRLMLAEMHRELGLLNEAMRFLDQARDLKFNDFCEKMREKIEKGERRVFLVR